MQFEGVTLMGPPGSVKRESGKIRGKSQPVLRQRDGPHSGRSESAGRAHDALCAPALRRKVAKGQRNAKLEKWLELVSESQSLSRIDRFDSNRRGAGAKNRSSPFAVLPPFFSILFAILCDLATWRRQQQSASCAPAGLCLERGFVHNAVSLTTEPGKELMTESA
jgi:hypothetical protein